MKFIHTSDWHIGRQFHGVSLLEDQHHVLEQIVDYAEKESVDALVVAGDIYDRSVPPAAAVELLDKVVDRVCGELNIPMIVIPGNHDSAGRLGFGSRQMRASGLHILSDLRAIEQPVVLQAPAGDVAFYGIPYNDPQTVRNLFSAEVASYEEAHRYLIERIEAVRDKAAATVLVSHCFLDGAEASESERPLSIGGADRVSYQSCLGFDYVALGHLHSPQSKGEDYIRYCGSILKYSFSEVEQHKGVTLVELDAQGFKTARHLPLLPLRDMRIVEGELNELIAGGKLDPNHKDYLLARLTDVEALLNPMAQLREVYPNILHLEKPGMLANEEQRVDRSLLKRGEREMFRDFFKQVVGQELSREQDKALLETLETLHRQEVEQ